MVTANWTFLTSHARVLLCIAHDPGVRLRDIAASVGITERSAYGIVTDLTEAGYIVKQKTGRRNRYQIQAHLPLPEPTSRERTVGEVLTLLIGAGDQDGAAGADAGDSAGIEGMAADQGANGARQVGTTLGPVQARTDRRAPAGGQR
jgi:IclR helix-turn-helix domain